MRPTRRSRTKQAAAWLREQFPTHYPVTVRWVRCLPLSKEDAAGCRARDRSPGYYGATDREGRRFVIRLSLRACRTIDQALEVLRHEWAHAHTWPHSNVEHKRHDHGPEFWVTLGEIERAWEDHGWIESRGY